MVDHYLKKWKGESGATDEEDVKFTVADINWIYSR